MSVYWNRIERKRKIRFSFSLSLFFSSMYWLILFNLLFPVRSVRLNIITLNDHLTNSFVRKKGKKSFIMRKIRFRYIKENGKSTSVTVRCSLKRKFIKIIFFIFYFALRTRGFISFTLNSFVVLSIIKILCRQI